MDAFQIVKKTVEEHGMADSGERVIVGFSGGPDSTCLLHCLYQLFGAERLTAVHVNHRLRGEAAERDAGQAADFCRALRIPFFLCRAEVRELADRMKLSEEDAGRRVRFFVFRQVSKLIQNQGESRNSLEELLHRQKAIDDKKEPGGGLYSVLRWEDMHDGSFFCEADAKQLERWLWAEQGGTGRYSAEQSRQEEQPRKYNGNCLIAVAQNADDQAETVLMRILRGTGVSGLGAMEYVRPDGVIRPLLDVSRRDVEAYCRAHGLHPSVDETNAEINYTRNRIRGELLPYLKENFNPNVVQALNRLALIARQDASFINDEAKRRLPDVVIEPELQSSERVYLDLTALRGQHPAIRTRILMFAFEMTGLSTDIAASHLRGAEKLIDTGKEGAVAEFPQNFRMKIRRGRAEIYREKSAAADGAAGYRIQLREVPAKEAWSLPDKETRRMAAEKSCAVRYGQTGLHGDGLQPCPLKEEVVFSHCFDGDAIEQSVFQPVLRTRKAGDYIRPLGMNGTKKLQDFLVDKKIPRELRDQILFICLGQEVVWVAGIVRDGGASGIELSYIGDPYKVRPDSHKILEISVRKLIEE